ncbi:hypothetical protein LDENG_00290020 [Lucifuga dentata]|nr:hypothetical protein LDENG_00290020 [Lucifuga dentata]
MKRRNESHCGEGWCVTAPSGRLTHTHIHTLQRSCKRRSSPASSSLCGTCWQMEDVESLLAVRSEEGMPKSRCRWSNDPQQSPESNVVEHFRRRLKYFFMNPCEKYRARGRKPWKLMLQIIKIAIITAQLVSFGLSNEMMVTFKDENLMTFKHLFLKGYQNRKQESFALYTKTDVYDHIYYVINRYVNLQNLTVGNHAYERIDGKYTPLSVCQEFYRNGSIYPGNETFDIDPHIDKECFSIFPLQSFDSSSLARHLNVSLDFKRLLSVNIYLTLKTINLQTIRHHELPDCYDFHIMIMFDNRAHSGKIKTDVENDVTIYECRDWNVEGTSGKNDYLLLLFDSLVILACFASLILCTRSVINGIHLQFEYTLFFHAYYNKIVSWSDRMEFVNGWYILIIVSDTLTITGSALKIGIQTKFLTNYDDCSILLGTATMLVWVGVIRYLGFFKKYNILILTLRAAFPNVIRFSCCAAMMYLGYCFCGWIVLGPYHEKFRTIDKVTDCLFSLLNGDDMYSTFLKMRDQSYMVWLFSRVYLYSFISLFIYMVLSLFIALITDTYETIKHHQQDKVPVSQLQAFIAECRDQPESGRYQTDAEPASCCASPSLLNLVTRTDPVHTGSGPVGASDLSPDCKSTTHFQTDDIASSCPDALVTWETGGEMYQSRHLSDTARSQAYHMCAFCTEDNIPQCVSYINQELASLGLSSTCIEANSPEGASLNTVPALNAMYELLQIHRRNRCMLEELEKEQLRNSSTLEHVQISNSRLKDQLELSIREKSGLHETERQLQLKIKTLQSCLKTEKDEVQKLQSIIASRASQYSHDAKRKERESAKLKERLSQLLADRKDKKLAIDVLNCLGRPDGRRSQWKTAKVTAGHESEMYKSLLSDYEASQRSLMLENAELKKVLQQMKREMIHILSPWQPCAKGATADDSQEQTGSDAEEKTGDNSRESLDQSCEQAREQLTNSIRQQWRRLKNHMEKLDSQASQVQTQLESSKEAITRETHEDEMERMRREVQQCKEFIHAQQQLLQQQLNTSFDDETAALLNDCYTLEEKERLKEEWRLFEEQKRNFERERKNFTEAAIRLGREKKAFEEDRATWLKNQFLNMTPFADRRRYSSSDCQSALSIKSEPEMRMSSSTAQLARSSTYATFSTPKAAQSPAAPSTAELYRTLRLIPESSSPRYANRGRWHEASTIEDGDACVKSKHRVQCGDLSIFSADEDKNSLP